MSDLKTKDQKFLDLKIHFIIWPPQAIPELLEIKWRDFRFYDFGFNNFSNEYLSIIKDIIKQEK